MDYKTIVINLSVLGKIDSGCKINTRGKYFELHHKTIYQSIVRFVYKEDRSMTISKLESLLNCVSEFVLNQKNLSDYLANLIEHAILGLNILKQTYESDITFSSELELVRNNLQELLILKRPTYDVEKNVQD